MGVGCYADSELVIRQLRYAQDCYGIEARGGRRMFHEVLCIFKGGRRKELQQEIDGIDIQISNMKKRISSIVKEYKFDSVQAFYKVFNASKREYFDYKAACAEYEKIYGNKVTDTMSVRDRLRQKERMVKEREAGRGISQGRKIRGRGS